MVSIGELAKKMGITVRTLQYYHREGILIPSATTEGGRRFYTNDDIVKLHEILSLKYLGFSLEDIKIRLARMDSPQDMVVALERQKQIFREQIAKLSQALINADILQQEIGQMKEMDFDRYAKIIEMLRQRSDSYWLFKLFNDKLAQHVSARFSTDLSAWAELYMQWEETCDQTMLLENRREPPEGDAAQKMAAQWWSLTMEFTGGDLTLIPELRKFEENFTGWNESMRMKISKVKEYRNRILECYFINQHIILN